MQQLAKHDDDGGLDTAVSREKLPNRQPGVYRARKTCVRRRRDHHLGAVEPGAWRLGSKRICQRTWMINKVMGFEGVYFDGLAPSRMPA